MLWRFRMTSRIMLGISCAGVLLTVYWLSSLIGVEVVTPLLKSNAPPVHLTVYYECLCPDSKRFIRAQLWRTYQAVPDIIEIELIPYGKASEQLLPNGTYAFRCQHGPDECYGNLVQTCAIKIYNETSKFLPFINCMETYPNSHLAGPKCAKRQDLDFGSIKQCTENQQGNLWQHEMAQNTINLNPRLHFVPWITVNGKYSAINQNRALTDLLRLVCETYEGEKPEACL